MSRQEETLEIRPLEVTDEFAFLRFNACLLVEKQTNPFIETVEVTDFLSYQEKLRRQETLVADPNWSRVTTYFAFLKEEIVGKISCRWELDKGNLATVGGHIGYVTAPQHRQKGIAIALLNFAFDQYKKRGIDSIFITALEDNLPSRRTIESVGGLAQDTIFIEDGKRLTRYWVHL